MPLWFAEISVGIYLLKINNETARIIREICSKLPIKAPEQCVSDILIINFKQISTFWWLCLWLWASKCQANKSQKLFYFCWKNDQKLPEHTMVLCQGVIQKIFLGGVSTKKCRHDCDQALIKSIHLVSLRLGYIAVSSWT